MWAQHDLIELVARDRELRPAEQLDRHLPRELGQVELGELGEPGEVGDDQDPLLTVLADERQDLPVLGVEELDRAPAERLVPLAQADDPAHPAEQ